MSQAQRQRLRLDQDDQALVFTGPMGTSLRHSNFYRRAWLPAVAKAGLPGIHFHDLLHAGNTLTADAGASLRELMDRMGHSSTCAALIYQHSSDERQRKLADAVDEAAQAALLKTARSSGTHVAREGQRTIVNVSGRPSYIALNWFFKKRARQYSNPRPAA